jgi:hypothetical protein
MDISITWNPGDTWRKLGYFYYTNSLEYRAVIEQNPQWNVMEEPPIGAVLSLNADQSRTLGTTNNSGFFSAAASDDYIEDLVFPFEYEQQFLDQAAKYSLYSLVNYNELNGYTQDTPEAASGNP